MSELMLEVTDLRAGFGHNTVLHGFSFGVARGEFAALLGLNGAGKSVTLKCVSGLLTPWSGSVRLDGRDITGLDPEDRVRAGIASVPQGRAVFPHLSVEENLRLGGATVRDRGAYRLALARTFEWFPRLGDRRRQLAGTLSGGEQAMLAVGRALMSSPKLVLIDEPSAGLSPMALGELLEIIRQINKAGVTVLMVEQNTTFAMRLADTVHVMQKGTIPLSAPVRELGDPSALLGHLGVGMLMRDRIRAVVASRARTPSDEDARPKRAKKTTTKKTTTRKATAKKATAKKATAKKATAKKVARKAKATRPDPSAEG